MSHLCDLVEMRHCTDAQAAGTTAVEGEIIDMQGYDAVQFVCHLGDVANGSVLQLKAQQDDVNAAGGMADLADTGADYTATATDADSKFLQTDIIKPEKRYLRPVLTRGTANAAVNSIIALLHKPRATPVTAPDVIAVVRTVSPLEGTA